MRYVYFLKVISYRNFTMLFNIDLLSKIYKTIILCQIFKYLKKLFILKLFTKDKHRNSKG